MSRARAILDEAGFGSGESRLRTATGPLPDFLVAGRRKTSGAPPAKGEPSFRIVRHYKSGRRSEVLARGLSRSDAKAWTSDPETSSKTAKVLTSGIQRTRRHGDWFEGFEQE